MRKGPAVEKSKRTVDAGTKLKNSFGANERANCQKNRQMVAKGSQIFPFCAFVIRVATLSIAVFIGRSDFLIPRMRIEADQL
jgi:hypothetical protein